ncbi:MAG TPA: acyltransferase [Methylophilus sp.]
MYKHSEKNANYHFLALDGVRGLAILWVLIFHATMTMDHHALLIQSIFFITHIGHLGVDIFFVLSGFLITGILLDSKHKSSWHFFGAFYYRRSLRIFPLYFAVILMLLIIPQFVVMLQTNEYFRYVDKQWWFWFYGANIVLEYYGFTNPILEFGWLVLTHFWSLAVEEHFYLFWPFLVYFLPTKKLVLTSLSLLMLSVFVRSGLVDISYPWLAAVLATPKYLGGLVIGSLGAICLRNFHSTTIIYKIARNSFCITLVMFFISLTWLNIELVEVFVIHMLVSLATMSVILMAVTKPENITAKTLEFGGLRFFGKYSYGIYVYHGLAIPLFRGFDYSNLPGGQMVGAMSYILLFCLIPILMSVLSYKYFEYPILKLKAKFS